MRMSSQPTKRVIKAKTSEGTAFAGGNTVAGWDYDAPRPELPLAKQGPTPYALRRVSAGRVTCEREGREEGGGGAK